MNFRIRHLAVWLPGILLAVCAMGPNPAGAKGSTPRGEFLTVVLQGPPIKGMTPMGEGEFAKTTGKNGTVQLMLELEFAKVNLPNGVALTVSLNGKAFRQTSLRGNSGVVQITTTRGGVVPDIKKGDTISISDPTGKVVLSGKF